MNIDWSSIKDDVAKVAPLLGTLVGGPAGGTVGAMISSALGCDPHPDAVAQALKTDPQAAVKLRQMELDNKVELQKLLVQSESNRLAAETNQLTEINKTMRAEAAANDAYVRRWRPTYGYVTAATWFLQACAITAAIVAASFVHPEDADKIMQGVAALMGALGLMWSIALSVLGINVNARSADKRVAAGQEGAGFFSKIADAAKNASAGISTKWQQ